MKRRLNLALLSSLLLAVTMCCSLYGQESTNASPTAAHNAVEAACKQAASESKAVFIKFGAPDCVWCRIFDRYHNIPEVRKILAKYYVIVALDSSSMPDAAAAFRQFANTAAPSWVIISASKKVIIDSFSPEEGNVGYPLQPGETAYYLAALKKATPSITNEELHILSQQITEAAAK